MSTRTETVLGDIDGALDAWGTVTREGSDAMRWSPERVICHGTGPLMPERWSMSRHGTYEIRVSADFSGFIAWLTAVQEAAAAWARQVFPGLQQAVNDSARAVASAFGSSWDGKLHYHPAAATHRQMRRCPLCNPGGFTSPLAIDGHDYRRRQRGRVRRKR